MLYVTAKAWCKQKIFFFKKEGLLLGVLGEGVIKGQASTGTVLHMVFLFLGAKSLQSCLICDLMYCSPPGSSVRGVLQARTVEWVSLTSPALAGRFFTTNATWEAHLFLVTQLRLQKVNLAASE